MLRLVGVLVSRLEGVLEPLAGDDMVYTKLFT